MIDLSVCLIICILVSNVHKICDNNVNQNIFFRENELFGGKFHDTFFRENFHEKAWFW